MWKECGCGVDPALVCPACGGKMVLINGQATCLACGVSPSPDEHASEKHHHHHHHHHHAGHAHEETKAVPDELAKQCMLLPHRIAHNGEHAAGFRRWAARASELGQEEAAQRIEEAVERMAACNQALADALETLEA